MIKTRKHTPLWGIIVSLSACSLHEETMFSRVVDDYQDEPQKVKAVEYLEKSINYQHGTARHFVDSLGNIATGLNPAEHKTDSAYRAYIDSRNIHLQAGRQVKDIDTLTEAFLKENIDLAFDSWQKPWAKDVSFQDFCKYVLPYRNLDEELSDWRRMLKERYEPSIMDSVEHPESLKEVAEYVMRQIRRDVHYSTKFSSLYSCQALTPKEILKLGGQECRGCAHYATLALRACGIPCTTIDLHWRFTEITHNSVMVPAVGNNKRAFRINIGDTLIYMGEPKDSMATWRTWAHCYEPNQKLIELSRKKPEATRFCLPYTREDITQLVCKTRDFAVPIPDSISRNNCYVFLCRYDNWHWYAIREGIVDSDSVRFQNATIRQWYQLGTWEGNSIKTFGDAFTLLGDGTIQKLNLQGDSVVFNIEYGYNPNEIELTRNDTLYYWGKNNAWESVCLKATLWGYDEKSKKEEPYRKEKQNKYASIYYRQRIKLPRFTVLNNKYMGRPIGFMSLDSIKNEAETMVY